MIKKIINWFRLRRDVRKIAKGMGINKGWHIEK